jgi:hypothetical protein
MLQQPKPVVPINEYFGGSDYMYVIYVSVGFGLVLGFLPLICDGARKEEEERKRKVCLDHGGILSI